MLQGGGQLKSTRVACYFRLQGRRVLTWLCPYPGLTFLTIGLTSGIEVMMSFESLETGNSASKLRSC